VALTRLFLNLGYVSITVMFPNSNMLLFYMPESTFYRRESFPGREVMNFELVLGECTLDAGRDGKIGLFNSRPVYTREGEGVDFR
jgi:hypothetical protein